MWPVLPSEELNEEFEWPIEGSLIPNSPPLKKPTSKTSDRFMPMRLKVLRNGDKNKFLAITIVGPDVTNMMLNRCTAMLKLPFAARRLFDENGKEITLLKGLQRDQLVYVSCGEQWIDPQLTIAEQKKCLLLSKLACDVSAVRNYCAMCNPEDLVLEVVGDLVAGARLTVAKCALDTEEKEDFNKKEELEVKEKQELDLELFDELLDSHAKSHRRTDAWHSNIKYPWQHNSRNFDEDDHVLQEENREFFTNAELFNKYRPQTKLVKVQQFHRQQFEFRDGHIVNCLYPGFVLGVQGTDVQSGTEVLLVEKKMDDVNQRWIHRENDKTFHLMSNPGLILAVSVPKIKPEEVESTAHVLTCQIVLQHTHSELTSSLQKYKGYSYGVANQKWSWIPEINVLRAFYTTVLDQEIMAANEASVCTFSVTCTEEVDQPGYYFTYANKKQKIMVCLACARAMRGKIILTKLPPGTTFYCAVGCKEAHLNPSGPFKYLHVTKIDLSTSEAENTLNYLEEMLTSLRKETSVQNISQAISVASTQRAVKVLAYRNGAGFRDGQLIIANTFAVLLSTCTRKLELSRPASRLYTVDGTPILTIAALTAWAINECFQENNLEEQECLDQKTDEEAREFPETQQDEQGTSTPQVLSQTTTENLDSIDDSLLKLILRSPIEVWVSCGEPFLPLDFVQRRQRSLKKSWLEKEKLIADLDTKKHKMRHQRGRRVGALEPAYMVPTKSPIQPVVVEGGWTEPTREEVKLMEDVQNMEMHLSEVKALQIKKRPSILSKLATSQRALYNQPNVKRVLVYRNGGNPEEGTYAWGKTIAEILDSCTSRLGIQQPVQLLYTPDGEQITDWGKVERDMLLCVSTGEPFMSIKARKQKVEVRANYARVRKHQGPDATDIVLTPKRNPKVQIEASASLLALPAAENLSQ
nr:PREDICTED: doublecortin domain-containing protein 5 [Latimeria chalumnae]|eukprot:XP_014341170.1 PREDICTED: doublecortin domain-containing protein 5 [Latimeria chalumnae]